jgi:hypothetical protein
VFFCLFLFVDLWFVVLLGCGAVRAVHNLILLAKKSETQQTKSHLFRKKKVDLFWKKGRRNSLGQMN